MHVEIYILQLGGNWNYGRQVDCSGPVPFVNDLQQVYFNYEILVQ